MDSRVRVSRKVKAISLLIVVVVICVVSLSFYFYYGRPAVVETVDLPGGKLTLGYGEDGNLLSVENLKPTSDMVGRVFDSPELFYDFTVGVTLDEASLIEYEIVAVKDEALSSSYDNNIKLYLEKEVDGQYVKVFGPKEFSSNFSDDQVIGSAMVVHRDKKDFEGEDKYRLRLWMSDTAVINQQTPQNYAVKIVIRGKAK